MGFCVANGETLKILIWRGQSEVLSASRSQNRLENRDSRAWEKVGMLFEGIEMETLWFRLGNNEAQKQRYVHRL